MIGQLAFWATYCWNSRGKKNPIEQHVSPGVISNSKGHACICACKCNHACTAGYLRGGGSAYCTYCGTYGTRPTVLLYCGSIHACIDDSALLVLANNIRRSSFGRGTRTMHAHNTNTSKQQCNTFFQALHLATVVHGCSMLIWPPSHAWFWLIWHLSQEGLQKAFKKWFL